MPRIALRRRAFLQAAGAAALVSCASPLPRPLAREPRLRLLGETTLPHGLVFEGTTVGGLSGIDHDPQTGTWVAISDDRSELQPARFYTLDVDIDPRGLRVQVKGVNTLRGANGLTYPKRSSRGETVDPEAIRLLPHGSGFLWASEGEERVGQNPMVTQSRMDGAFVRRFDTPAMLRFGKPGTGPRNNTTFEGLALTPDARTLWVAMEGPLRQDGPLPTLHSSGGPCRFTAFDLTTGEATRQIPYLLDPIPLAPRVPGTFADNGASEILALDEHRLLVLERCFALGSGLSLRIYAIDTRAGSDTLRQDQQLAAGSYTAPPKMPVVDFAQLGLSRLDNTEGLCWGPRLANGNRTLVAVSDDNFNKGQVTQFAAFEFLE